MTARRHLRSGGRRPLLRRLFAQRRARLGVLTVAGVFGAGLVTLPCSLSWYDHQSLEHVRSSPSWRSPVPYEGAAALRFEKNWPGGHGASLGRWLFQFGGLLGLDSLGRSLFYRCLLGGTISLAIGLFAAAVSVTLGLMWGSIAGLAGGRVDLVLMRIVDILYGLPYILVVILLKVTLEAPLQLVFNDTRLANIVILFVAIGANSWLTMSRIVRGQVLSLKQQAFVEVARTCGAGWPRIIIRHLLPNLAGPIFVYGTLIVPQAILSESFLSFLGIGIQRPMPTWGSLVAEGLQSVNSVVNYWWLIVFPCVLLSVTLLALNFIGDGLRDAFDPRSNSSP